MGRNERPPAVWWRFWVGVVTFPAIGGVALTASIWTINFLGVVLAGEDLIIFQGENRSILVDIASSLIPIAIVACMFGSPVGAVIAILGHVFTDRGPIAAAILAIIAGTLAFSLCLLVMQAALAEDTQMVTWYLGVIPISAALGFLFSRWVYPIRNETLVDTFA